MKCNGAGPYVARGGGVVRGEWGGGQQGQLPPPQENLTY